MKQYFEMRAGVEFHLTRFQLVVSLVNPALAAKRKVALGLRKAWRRLPVLELLKASVLRCLPVLVVNSRLSP